MLGSDRQVVPAQSSGDSVEIFDRRLAVSLEDGCRVDEGGCVAQAGTAAGRKPHPPNPFPISERIRTPRQTNKIMVRGDRV